MKITAHVTRYHVSYDDDPHGQIHEVTGNEETTVEVQGGWLHIFNCAGSMPFDRLAEAIESGGWYAQSGTAPVYVEPCPHPHLSHECCGRTCESPNGGWGGRNYPRIFVPADELVRIQEAVTAHAG